MKAHRCRSMRPRSRPSPSSAPMHGRRFPAAAVRRRQTPLNRSASSPASPTWSAQTSHVLYTRGLPEMNDVFWQHPLGDGAVQGSHLSQQGLHRNSRDCDAARHHQLQAGVVGPRGQDSAQHSLHRIVQGRQGRQVSGARRRLGRRSLQGQRRWQAGHRADPGRRPASRVCIHRPHRRPDRQRGRRLPARLRRQPLRRSASPTRPT